MNLISDPETLQASVQGGPDRNCVKQIIKRIEDIGLETSKEDGSVKYYTRLITLIVIAAL